MTILILIIIIFLNLGKLHQDDITIPDTYITSIDVLNTLSGKSLAEQYNILAELFNTLPKTIYGNKL